MDVAIVGYEEASKLKFFLKKKSFYENKWLAETVRENKVALPVNKSFINFCEINGDTASITDLENVQFKLCKLNLNVNSKKERSNPLSILKNNLQKINMWNEELMRDLPNSYEKFGDVLLVSDGSFKKDTWDNRGLWNIVASSFGCKRIARKYAINNDNFRTPRITMILGEDGWIEHTDNGVIYSYDITKCMFSPGNITEKLRISKFDCSDETVVDLYAGIGYFTLPYLVHAKARKVIACEWNSAAVKALNINLQLNKVADRCTVLQGDNKKTCPHDVADRVNLGLIPSSEDAWVTSCRALRKDKGGILHVHGNVIGKKFLETSNIILPDGNIRLDDPQESKMKECRETDEPHSVTKSNGFQLGKEENETQSNRGKRSYQKIRRKQEWIDWAIIISSRLKDIFFEIHHKEWSTEVVHVEHVKSYAPRIDHIVADIKCWPIYTLQ